MSDGQQPPGRSRPASWLERVKKLRAREPRESVPEGILRNPSRVAALRRSGLMDTPSEEAFDRLTRIAAKVLDAPVALFTLVDEERQFCKSCVGLPDVWISGRDSPLSYSFCQHAVALGAPLVIQDARKHPLVRRDPATMRGVIAYAGVPLVTSEGFALGTLCVIDFQPRSWSPEEVQLLDELAAAVVNKIELRVAVREAEEKARAAERAQAALRESEERFRTAFDAAPIGMALVATDGRWIRVNQALSAIVGYSREELLARSFQEITHPDDLATDWENVERLLRGEAVGYAMEKRYLHKDGREVWMQLNVSLVRDDTGEPFHFIAQIQDITGRKREEEELRSLTFADELTGLFNRRAFVTMAGEQLKAARRQGRPMLLLVADVDQMGWINDSFGHGEGDRALLEAAELLRATFRESDLIARMGGDDFAVLASAPEPHGEMLLDRLQERVRMANKAAADRAYPLSISVGVARLDPQSPATLDALLERADAAMRRDRARQRPT